MSGFPVIYLLLGELFSLTGKYTRWKKKKTLFLSLGWLQV